MSLNALVAAVALIVFGLLALLLGKRLFWLFAGIVGFALGWWLISLLLPPNTDPLLHVLVGVIVGLILAGLSFVVPGNTIGSAPIVSPICTGSQITWRGWVSM